MSVLLKGQGHLNIKLQGQAAKVKLLKDPEFNVKVKSFEVQP